MSRAFDVTWDYRCPFARIGHDHILTGLADGADWEVGFKAFSLDQTHVEEGQPPVWEEPDKYPGLTANLAGIVVRDQISDQFPAVHRALFEARHVHAMDMRDRDIVAKVLDEAGADGAGIMAEVDKGWPLTVLRDEHTAGVEQHQVWGVPIFIAGDQAVFVRLMKGPFGDAAVARQTVERILDLISGWPDLNEFKHTALPK